VHVHPFLSAVAVDVKLDAHGIHFGSPPIGAYVFALHELHAVLVGFGDVPASQFRMHVFVYGDHMRFGGCAGHMHDVKFGDAFVPDGHA